MENLTLISLFLIGLSYGATACMFSCMPFLAPLLISNSSKNISSLKVVVPFSIGRVFTYILIAIVSSFSSIFIKSILNDNEIFQLLLGILTIFMGIILLYITFKSKNSCKSFSKDKIKKREGFIGLFSIGALVSLNPCVPVLTLITLSANTSTIFSATLYGIFFGIGAVLVPFIFYTLIVGNIFRGLIEQFKSYINQIQIFASLLLILVGVMVIAGKISL